MRLWPPRLLVGVGIVLLIAVVALNGAALGSVMVGAIRSPAVPQQQATVSSNVQRETTTSCDEGCVDRAGWRETATPNVSAPGTTYYVAPGGSDGNPGTQARPWRTFRKAARSLRAGDTAIFEDGVYLESDNVGLEFSGTADAPITFRGRNPLQAHIEFTNDVSEARIPILGDHIHIEDLKISAPDGGEGAQTTTNVLIRWYPDGSRDGGSGQYGQLTGNYLTGAWNTVKLTNSNESKIVGNIIYAPSVGVNLVGGYKDTIAYNEIYLFRQDENAIGIDTKGATKNNEIHHNKIIVDGFTGFYGIGLGGFSSYNRSYIFGDRESFGSVAYSNVVLGINGGGFAGGYYAIYGGADSSIVHNVAVGRSGVAFVAAKGGSPPGDFPNGYPRSKNVHIRNNIAVGMVTGARLDTDNIEGVLDVDYNLFHDVIQDIPAQAHPIVGDPRFVDQWRDWHVQPGSPAIDAAEPWRAPTVDSDGVLDGGSHDTSRDYYGVTRSVRPEVGVAEYRAVTRAAPALAGPADQATYFPETGHNLIYGFKHYWEANGGLEQFGFPITEEFREVSPIDGQEYTVQYFERARFEYHPEHKGTPFEVELGLLGRQATAVRQGEPPFLALAGVADTPERRFFAATGHTLSGGFLAYWERHGGLARFGYPISEEFREANPADGRTYTVQYFERARFEHHPERQEAGSPVLLGLLGRQMVGRGVPTLASARAWHGLQPQAR